MTVPSANTVLSVQYMVTLCSGADNTYNELEMGTLCEWVRTATAYLGECSSTPLCVPGMRRVVPRGVQLLKGERGPQLAFRSLCRMRKWNLLPGPRGRERAVGHCCRLLAGRGIGLVVMLHAFDRHYPAGYIIFLKACLCSSFSNYCFHSVSGLQID